MKKKSIAGSGSTVIKLKKKGCEIRRRKNKQRITVATVAGSNFKYTTRQTLSFVLLRWLLGCRILDLHILGS